MNGKLMLYLDQYGNPFWARTLTELRAAVGGGTVAPMYVDKKDGTTVKTGYVVGNHWCTAYLPYEEAA